MIGNAFRMVALSAAVVFASVSMNVAAAGGVSFIVEAESHDRIEFSKAKKEKYGRPASEIAASNGRTMIGLFADPEARVLYDFEAPADGLYRVWLRYGVGGDTRVDVAIDPKGEEDLGRTDLPATGGYMGFGVWNWEKVFEGPLKAGPHRLMVRYGAMRPDCFYFTTSDKEVDDSVLDLPEKTRITPEIKTLLEKPYPPATPDFIRELEGYELPAWYDNWRVHAHTRLGARRLEEIPDNFFTAAQAFRDAGYHVFVRHIRTMDEPVWWPSKYGPVHERARERNWAKEILDSAHKAGMKVIIYHAHSGDAGLAEQHPEWICRDWNGEPLRAMRGLNHCLNSPYLDVLTGRLLELAEMGADGLFFDELHMPKNGCWCKWCEASFRKDTGLDLPAGGIPGDPVYQRLIDHKNLTIERAFVHIRKALARDYPDVVMVIGSNTYPSMCQHHMSQRCLRIAHSHKTEFTKPDGFDRQIFGAKSGMKIPEQFSRRAMGYALSRDMSDGRPAHIWAHNLPNEEHAMYAMAGIVTWGNIANIDNRENKIADPLYFEAVEVGNRVSPYFGGSRPWRWAAVHYPELARNNYPSGSGEERYEVWKQCLYPMIGGFKTFLLDRLPVATISDSQLEQGRFDGVRVLFLPAPNDLTPAMAESVAAFRRAGGAVIEQEPSWVWHEEGAQEKAMAALRQRLGNLADEAPTQVFGGPRALQAATYRSKDGNRVTLAMCNDFTWVHVGRHRDQEHYESLIERKPPPPIEGVTAVFRGERAPKKVFEAVTGRTLTPRKTARGWEVAPPTFGAMSVVVAEY